MKRRSLRALLPIALLAPSACQHAPSTARQSAPVPLVASASESLIPPAYGQRPATPSLTPSRRYDDPPTIEEPRQLDEAVADAPASSKGTRRSSVKERQEISLASLQIEEPGRFALQDATPPMAPPAEAEDGTPIPSFPSATMTLLQFESMALASNPSIQQASAVAHKAMGTRLQVGLCPNPTVAYTGQEIGDNGTYGQQGFQVSQTIVRGDKLEWSQRVADQEVQALLWQVEAQRQRVLTDVRRQFYATLGAQERLEVAAELESIATEAADKSRLLFENQQGARPDLLQAETQLSELTILRRQAEFDQQANWQQLVNLVGQPNLTLAQIDAPLDSPELERSWESSLQQVLGANPQLHRAYAEAQRARVGIERAEVEPIPNVEVQAGVMHMAESDNVGANLQIGLPLPLFNKNQGNIDRAWSEYHRAQWNAERLRLSIQAQLAAAFGDYRDAANRVAIYRDEIIPRQQETLELIELGYPAQFDFLRLFTARRSYYDARIQYLNALVALRQSEALIDGLLLTGGLSDIDDTTIDDGLREDALDGQ